MNSRLSFTGMICGSIILLISGSASAGLIAHWTGDGTALDSSGNGHNGALFGTATYGTGVFGQAFQFGGGNGFVEIPGTDALEPSVFSISAWIKAAPGGGLRLVADTSHGTTTTEGGWALQLLSGGTIDFTYGNGTTFPHISSSAVVADNTFHHVAATLSGSDMRIYVDGILSGENLSYTGPPTDSIQNNGNVRLGRHFNLNRQLTGLIDDVRIYNHELSLPEIATLSAVAVPEPSALAALAVGCLVILRRRRPSASATRDGTPTASLSARQLSIH